MAANNWKVKSAPQKVFADADDIETVSQVLTMKWNKTFTVDPISHRRLDNLGESDKYLLKDHHEAIVSSEVFDKAQEILAKRGKCRSNARLRKDEYRNEGVLRYDVGVDANNFYSVSVKQIIEFFGSCSEIPNN